LRGGHHRKFLGFAAGNARAQLFARGISLPPVGSIEDRLMREVVFRERQEKVLFFESVTRLVARILGVDAERAFGDLSAAYAGEVFQHVYDADLMRKKLGTLREARGRVQRKRQEDLRLLGRLERLGVFYDQALGKEVHPVERTPSPRKPRPGKKRGR
jgi:hypothetical protein